MQADYFKRKRHQVLAQLWVKWKGPLLTIPESDDDYELLANAMGVSALTTDQLVTLLRTMLDKSNFVQISSVRRWAPVCLLHPIAED